TQKVLEGLDLDYLVGKICKTGTRERAIAISALLQIEPLIKDKPEMLVKVRQVVFDGVLSNNKDVQIMAMIYLRRSTLISDINDEIIDEITRKMNGSDAEVAEVAILCLNQVQGSSTDPARVERTVKMLDEPDPKLKKTALKSALSIIDKVGLDIHPETLEGLVKSDDKEILALSSELAGILVSHDLAKYRPSLIEPVLLSGNTDIVKKLLSSLKETILKHPREFLPVLSTVMSKSDIEIKDLVRPLLVSIGSRDDLFSAVLDVVLNIKEDTRFTVRNFAREILVDIGKNVPEKMIPLIETTLIGEKDKKKIGNAILFLEDRLKTRIDNENFRINAASAIGDLGEIRPDLVDIDLLLVNATQEKNWRIRRDLVTSLGKLAPLRQDFPVDKYVALSTDENANVRVALVRGIAKIVKEKPDAVNEQFLKNMLLDENDDVRENVIKIATNIGGKKSDIVIPLLVQGLHDAKWSVKNASAEALGALSRDAPENIPVDILLDIMLNDKDKWTKWQATLSLRELCKVKPGAVTIKDIAPMSISDDENLAVAFLALLRHVDPNPMDAFFKVIDPFMSSGEKNIQEQVTQTLYEVHPKIKVPEEFLSHLLQVASDKDSSINKIHASVISMGKIAKYGTDDVKKRVKKV
nr:HEAT repeat domain-containing protein [Candidatus Sigynarchaeota archaeon]